MKNNPIAKAIVLKPDGDVFKKYFADEKPTLAEMQEIVAGPIEIIRMSESELMIVNEEGLLLGLPFNEPAVNYIRNYTEDEYQIVGNVFVIDSSLVD